MVDYNLNCELKWTLYFLHHFFFKIFCHRIRSKSRTGAICLFWQGISVDWNLSSKLGWVPGLLCATSTLLWLQGHAPMWKTWALHSNSGLHVFQNWADCLLPRDHLLQGHLPEWAPPLTAAFSISSPGKDLMFIRRHPEVLHNCESKTDFWGDTIKLISENKNGVLASCGADFD